jgi:hypothetical protein
MLPLTIIILVWLVPVLNDAVWVTGVAGVVVLLPTEMPPLMVSTLLLLLKVPVMAEAAVAIDMLRLALSVT